jgi:ketosteroid isomerase-like protein
VTTWTRAELEEAFAAYQRAGQEAAKTGNWSAWADLFTDDAVYVEHLFGTFHGREAIRQWITNVMSTFPGNAMPEFPIEWHVVDEERGWIVCKIWNRMADPGDGSVFEAANFTLLKYAGNGRWSGEEDIYNPNAFSEMAQEWSRRKHATAERAGGEAPST